MDVNCDCFVSMAVPNFVITAIEAMVLRKRVIVSEEFYLNAIGGKVDAVKTVPADINILSTKLTYLPYISRCIGKNIVLMTTLIPWEHLAKEYVK
mgnify:CR=1 FL=1